jgi:BirA family transcriptional regulator, biotin operon repressor / biotin---[acetyl-CoA-carboxylase] ligase
VAIARAIEFIAAQVSARIKWPNDVHVAGGKVAGILVESVASRSDRLVIGVGLNVATELQRFASGLAAPARSLGHVTRASQERYDWLPEVMVQMRRAYQQLAVEPERLVAELRARCLLTGSEVRYQCGDTLKQGRCIGIDHQGALLVQNDRQIVSLRSGEVQQVRPL